MRVHRNNRKVTREKRAAQKLRKIKDRAIIRAICLSEGSSHSTRFHLPNGRRNCPFRWFRSRFIPRTRSPRRSITIKCPTRNSLAPPSGGNFTFNRIRRMNIELPVLRYGQFNPGSSMVISARRKQIDERPSARGQSQTKTPGTNTSLLNVRSHV